MLVLNISYFLIFSVFVTLIIPRTDVKLLRQFGLCVFSILFIYSILLIFVNNTHKYFEIVTFMHLPGLSYFVGLDIISALFILLTHFVMLLCILSSWSSIRFNYKTFLFIMLLIDLFLVNLFSTLDLFFFYIFFESILVPMFLLIGIWGSRQRRTHAALQFFFFTLFGSFFMLAGLVLLYSYTGTTNIMLLDMYDLTEERQLVLWVFFFLAFAIKIPMFPFHIWLPEAHVEAPTVGSVILAGILLKLGGYGFIRFMLPLLPYANNYYTPFVMTIATLGVLYTSLTAIRQIDLKKIIAYASISHMNFVVLGIFNNTGIGVMGSVFLMLGHGIVSSGLFFGVGVLYERYHTRLLRYYGGLAYVMPLYAVLFFILILANFSFPGTCNFVGEFLILVGLFSQNMVSTFLVLLSIIFSLVYSVWLYNRLFFGFSNPKALLFFADLSNREFIILFSCVVLTIFFGFCPNLLLHKLEFAVGDLLWTRY